jgi:hypothetical protein
MKRISIHDPDAAERVLEAMLRAPVIVQFPTVYTLMAMPTSTGAAQLDELKTRLPNKRYGTAIGSLEAFLGHASPEHLPPQFNRPEHFQRLCGAFLRVRFRDAGVESQTLHDGTHQGLLLPAGAHATLFQHLEAAFQSLLADAMWHGRNHAAPLCTSCNVSGDVLGSITDRDRALEFAQVKGIALFVTTECTSAEKGSYPVFGFERDGVRVHRDGPKLAVLKRQIPWSLLKAECAAVMT